jgi:hypothetical protein
MRALHSTPPLPLPLPVPDTWADGKRLGSLGRSGSYHPSPYLLTWDECVPPSREAIVAPV